MPRFSYRTFRMIFALGNSVVWFFILSGLAHLVYEHFAVEDGFSRDGVWAFFILTPFVSGVLASQGAIVNLREQYLIGRFALPSGTEAARPMPSNPWLVSLRHAPAVALVAAVVTTIGLHFVPYERFSLRMTANGMGGIGAMSTLVLALIVADREFRRFYFHLGGIGRRVGSLERYVATHLAAPWALINAALNGVFAWMLYHQGPGHPARLVSIGELRDDLVITTFMICVFTALAVIPEVETDFAAGMTPPEEPGPAMPRLWVRYGLALGLASVVWLVITGTTHLTHSAGLSLEWTIAIKAAGGGSLAALAAAQCGRWTLARCLARATSVAAPRRATVA